MIHRWLGLILILLAGCSTVNGAGVEFDKVCVKGRLTSFDAGTINMNHPDWRHKVVAQDRVVNRECSELLRELTGRD